MEARTPGPVFAGPAVRAAACKQSNKGMKRILAALLLLTLAAPAWAGWNEGVAAHKRGDYATETKDAVILALDIYRTANVLVKQHGEACASSLSYLARLIMRRSPIGRFDEVAADLVARRDATRPCRSPSMSEKASLDAGPRDASSVLNFNGVCGHGPGLAQAASRS